MLPALPGFHIMAKPTGPICNLDCKYCFYLEKEKLYPKGERWAMPTDVLESFVRQHIEAHKVPEVQFAWQGGEPTLLGVDYYRKVVELQAVHAGGKTIKNAFQTNGVLLDDEWCRFFREHDFLIGLSIDGPRELHDFYRVDRGGKPSFHKVMRGLESLKRHGVEFNTLTVVNRANQDHPLEVYRFLKEIGSTVLQFIPLVERGGPGDQDPTERSVQPEAYGRFLCAIFDEWVQHDVGRTFVQLFDIALEAWMGVPSSMCWFRETCGAALALEHNGDLYSCDHYVFPENKLGNIMDAPLASLVNSPQQQQFGEEKRSTLPAQCQRCEVRFACHGECPKHRFTKTEDGEDGLNFLCAGYLRFFRHISPYMKIMSGLLRNRQSPAHVMTYAPRLEVAFAQCAPEEPCPCQSNQPYSACCGRTRLQI